LHRDKNNQRQQSTNQSKVDANSAMIQVLLEEKNFINGVKKAMSVPECEEFVLWILRQTAPLKDAYTGSAETYYKLGKQKVGKEITRVLTEAEYKLSVTDISDELMKCMNKMDNIEKEIAALNNENEEAKKNGRRHNK
jgi:Mg2+ and Co2+ transporter CorA